MFLVQVSRLVPAVAAALALAGCGSGTAPPASSGGVVTASPGPGGVQTVTIEGNDSMRFVPATVVVHAGTVRLTLRDVGAVPHTFDVPSLGVHSGNVNGGAAVTVTFTVRHPGRYPFDCAYHVDMGMRGTLVVR